MLSRTVISGKRWMGGTVRPMPRRYTTSALRPVMSSPRKNTWPAEGWSTPVTQLKSVVLPDPLGPMSPSSSPGSTLRLTRLSAETEEVLGEVADLEERHTRYQRPTDP